MAATKKAAETETVMKVELPQIDLGVFTVNIVGDSPLIVHKWSHKAKEEMLGKQMKKASKGKDAKVPAKDFVDSLYWLNEDGTLLETPQEIPEELENITNDTPLEEIAKVIKKGRFGFPACAFKASAIDAGYQQGVIAKKTTARGAFHIIGEYAVIEGVPEMREDMVQIGGMSKVADIRYRPMFKEWKTTLTIKYNKKAITPEQIMNLLNYGGFANGVGEWRPSKDGSFGTFHVE
jgi:hypothetical protein